MFSLTTNATNEGFHSVWFLFRNSSASNVLGCRLQCDGQNTHLAIEKSLSTLFDVGSRKLVLMYALLAFLLCRHWHLSTLPANNNPLSSSSPGRSMYWVGINRSFTKGSSYQVRVSSLLDCILMMADSKCLLWIICHTPQGNTQSQNVHTNQWWIWTTNWFQQWKCCISAAQW